MEKLREVFAWAHRRSALAYGAIRRSLGEPEPFRLRHRELLRETVGHVVRVGLVDASAAAHVEATADAHLPESA